MNINNLVNSLFFEIDANGEFSQTLPNGRVVWAETIDDEEYFSTHILIELRCSEAEWDMKNSEYAERRDPAIIRYIVSKYDNIEDVIRVLIMRNTIIPIKAIDINIRSKLDTIGYDIELLLGMVPSNIENNTLSELFEILEKAMTTINNLKEGGII